jgi:hypothetical protein
MEIIRMQPAGLVVSPALRHVAIVPAGARIAVSANAAVMPVDAG